ncbi:MAG: response regulator [Thermodesulfobacteriota bacterium]|nr:response regulator [Thermodesulfobacteriota bacterium]
MKWEEAVQRENRFGRPLGYSRMTHYNPTVQLLPNRNNRVLIIDDNWTVHDDMREVLNPQENISTGIVEIERSLFGGDENKTVFYEIDSAYQGEEGIGLVCEAYKSGNPYAVAFVDIRMPPGIDGIETVKRIWGIYPELEVVFCTAFSDYTWTEMVKELGSTDRFLIMKKPFDSIMARQLAFALTEKWNKRRDLLIYTEKLEQMITQCKNEIFHRKGQTLKRV